MLNQNWNMLTLKSERENVSNNYLSQKRKKIIKKYFSWKAYILYPLFTQNILAPSAVTSLFPEIPGLQLLQDLSSTDPNCMALMLPISRTLQPTRNSNLAIFWSNLANWTQGSFLHKAAEAKRSQNRSHRSQGTCSLKLRADIYGQTPVSQNFKGQLKESVSLKYFTFTLCIHSVHIRLEITSPAHTCCCNRHLIASSFSCQESKDESQVLTSQSEKRLP